MAAGWSSLPRDVVLLLADRLIADNDIDCYMHFRAVCSNWRKYTVDPNKEHPQDPRFQPKTWAVLKNYGYLDGNCAISMVNLRTCRVLCKKIPMFHKYYFFNATDGGFLVLGEKSRPYYRAWVLNPFTGSMVSFTVPIFAETVKAVAVTTSPTMRLFVFDLWTFLGWADPVGQGFQEYRVPYDNFFSSMMQVAGDVYVADRYGSIVSMVDEEGSQQGRPSKEMVRMTPAIEAAPSWIENDPCHYLVESAGELFLVSRRSSGESRHFVEVHKADTTRKILEPVTNIGRRAIFVSQVRSFFINAFATIEAGCIYFVDPTLDSFRKYRIIATSYRLTDQRQEDIVAWSNLGLRAGPPTLVEVLADYCRFIPIFEHEFVESSEEDELEGFRWDDGSTQSYVAPSPKRIRYD